MHYPQILILLLSVITDVVFASPVPLPLPAELESVDAGGSLGASAACTSPRCQTDRLLFSRSLSEFLSAKSSRTPRNLIWYDDGCSNAPDKPRGYNFLDSCYRHDFGYKNYKSQSRFTEDNRGKIDKKFKDDLYNECNKYSGLRSWKGVECRRIADGYYSVVRQFGNREIRIPNVDIPGL